MVSQNLYVHNNMNHMQHQHQHPMTAAVDGAANRFAQQQMMGMNGGGAAFMDPQMQMQALQLQMMQMEIARLQVRSTSFIVLSRREQQ